MAGFMHLSPLVRDGAVQRGVSGLSLPLGMSLDQAYTSKPPKSTPWERERRRGLQGKRCRVRAARTVGAVSLTRSVYFELEIMLENRQNAPLNLALLLLLCLT